MYTRVWHSYVQIATKNFMLVQFEAFLIMPVSVIMFLEIENTTHFLALNFLWFLHLLVWNTHALTVSVLRFLVVHFKGSLKQIELWRYKLVFIYKLVKYGIKEILQQKHYEDNDYIDPNFRYELV